MRGIIYFQISHNKRNTLYLYCSLTLNNNNDDKIRGGRLLHFCYIIRPWDWRKKLFCLKIVIDFWCFRTLELRNSLPHSREKHSNAVLKIEVTYICTDVWTTEFNFKEKCVVCQTSFISFISSFVFLPNNKLLFSW